MSLDNIRIKLIFLRSLIAFSILILVFASCRSTREKAKLTNEQIPSTFNNLVDQTNFPSLYAAQSLWEDFAESFATYFHVIIDKRPWQIIIEQKGKPEIVIGSCWNEERCRIKKEYMKRWFENPLALRHES
jgi:hypothetical protein